MLGGNITFSVSGDPNETGEAVEVAGVARPRTLQVTVNQPPGAAFTACPFADRKGLPRRPAP
jgi:hypothetical protein